MISSKDLLLRHGMIPRPMIPSTIPSVASKKRPAKKSKEDTKAYKADGRCGAGQCKNDAMASKWGVASSNGIVPICAPCVMRVAPITGMKLIARTPEEGPALTIATAVSQTLVHIALTKETRPALCGAVKGVYGLGPKLTPLTVAWYRWCLRCLKKWEKLDAERIPEYSRTGKNKTSEKVE